MPNLTIEEIEQKIFEAKLWKAPGEDGLPVMRPISLLSTLGKILEVVIAERILYAIETFSLLPTNHFGARKRHSAEQALLLLQEEIYKAWRNRKYVTRRLLAALQTHANARRYDQAQKIKAKFTKFMQDKGFPVALTEPIERPPIPSYQQVEIDQTISDNQGRAGFNTELEQTVRDFVKTENSAGFSKKHVETIEKALNVYNNLAEACKAA
ncbi:hypothetical protein TSTA_102150 [Talaromyces stipitatus ATCC 10500]|uniref:Reverse transcriptase n=1 Tax=Talaromyces stipitatus (strain ATCC 10500 / CBS 375.48 / QM 6759 / NRRL 1006) TaxID=441959 RepID=B8MN36_TALSN|nr:uncharacterized protein TSTA_102150 [Talaromyces stipitatus ATCC 10500]EED13985.1 hypothetical protein TSTA_102150 [Talaromyces stipitatus ATCC 10500]